MSKTENKTLNVIIGPSDFENITSSVEYELTQRKLFWHLWH